MLRLYFFFAGVQAGLSGPKLLLRYSTNASRSFASTTAPQRTILSTSLAQVFLSRRCCRTIVASWHSRHAVRTRRSIGAGGSGGPCCAIMATPPAAISASTNHASFGLADIDLHLVPAVPQITRGIPRRGLGLHAAGAVGGARHQQCFARALRTPRQAPQPPRKFCLFAAKLRRLPVLSAISREVNFHDLVFARPRGAINPHLPADGRALRRMRDHRLHVERGERNRIFRTDFVAGRDRMRGDAIAWLHVVADELMIEHADLAQPLDRGRPHPSRHEDAHRKAVV